MMDAIIYITGLPLAIGVCVMAHKRGRRWWAWALLCVPLTPLGAAAALAFCERKFLAAQWRKRG